MRDFFRKPLAEHELRALIGDHPVSDAFSWRSPSVKAMMLDVEQLRMSGDEMVRLMLREPRLIRRPILVAGGTATFGATAKQAAEALAQS